MFRLGPRAARYGYTTRCSPAAWKLRCPSAVEVCRGRCAPTLHGMRDIETIDAELRLVAALRRAARERGGPLPSIDVADALLD
jgi:hypothetical protein